MLKDSLFTLRYFSLFKFKVLSKRLLFRLAFLLCNASHSKQAVVFSLPQFYFPAVYSLPSSQRSAISWSDPSDPIPLYFLYIKPFSPSINNSVLILFLIGKAFTGISVYRLHSDNAHSFRLRSNLSQRTWLAKFLINSMAILITTPFQSILHHLLEVLATIPYRY